MGNTHVTPVVITGSAKPNPNVAMRPFALFAVDGTPLIVPKKMPAQANSTATDVPGIVTDFNALLTKLRTAGLLT